MPLIVYLDTQDYIKLFNEPVGGQHHQVIEELKVFRDAGKIVIGFSFATVLEFITKPNAENRDERVRRGQLIKDICGSNAFPFPSSIPRRVSFPNKGVWMLGAGKKFVTAKDFREKMEKNIWEKVLEEKRLNRQQRRHLLRNKSIKNLAHEIDFTWGRERSDWGDFPVSDEFIESRIFERFIHGKCSDSEFENRMNAWLSDPAEYSRIVYDYADQPNFIEKLFGESSNKLERSVIEVQELVLKIKKHNEQALERRAALVEAGVTKSKARNATKQLVAPKWDTLGFGAKLEDLFGKGRAGHFSHYFKNIFKPGFSFKRSDIMDLMQMCYAYDCDLFRCDKAMAHTFRDYEPFQGKLANSFFELPNRIGIQLD